MNYYGRQSKPVMCSLDVLDWASKVEYVEGSTKGASLYPFVVKLTEPLNNGLHFVCRPTELHRVADEVLGGREP